jgi:hypothetical protein
MHTHTPEHEKRYIILTCIFFLGYTSADEAERTPLIRKDEEP